MNLVIDTWVWASTEDLAKIDSLESLYCASLIGELALKCTNKIICDFDGEIIQELEKHVFRVRHIVPYYMRMCQTSGKFHLCAMNPLSKTLKQKLSGFDEADMKFLKVALSMPGPIVIVSGDKHFLRLRKKMETGQIPELSGKIQIMIPQEALEELRKQKLAR